MADNIDKKKDADMLGDSNTDSKGDVQTKNKTVDTNKQDVTPASAKTFTEEEMKALLEKVRQDEKRKVYGRVEELSLEKEEREKQIDELKKKNKEIMDSLDQVRAGASSELETVTKELQQLRNDNVSLSEQIKTVGERAELRVRNSELNAYRERKIRESKLVLDDNVSGTSEAEIDASIEKALKREQEIREELRQQVRAEMADSLPKPIAPDGSSGRIVERDLSSRDREAIARLKSNEFAAKKQELLQAALKKTGYGR
jgi:hypothetical protein